MMTDETKVAKYSPSDDDMVKFSTCLESELSCYLKYLVLQLTLYILFGGPGPLHFIKSLQNLIMTKLINQKIAVNTTI